MTTREIARTSKAGATVDAANNAPLPPTSSKAEPTVSGPAPQTSVTIPKVIVTVSTGGEGKTTLANALISNAMLRHVEVKIFDADAANESLRRPFALPQEQVLKDTTQDALEVFFEEKVYGYGPSVRFVDIGATSRLILFTFLRNRGQVVANNLHVCVPIGKIDTIRAAGRLIENTPCPVLLVLNEHSSEAVAAIKERPEFQRLLSMARGCVAMADGGRTVLNAHLARKSFFDVATHGGMFDQAGMLAWLRGVEKAFAHHPEFAPWS